MMMNGRQSESRKPPAEISSAPSGEATIAGARNGSAFVPSVIRNQCVGQVRWSSTNPITGPSGVRTPADWSAPRRTYGTSEAPQAQRRII